MTVVCVVESCMETNMSDRWDRLKSRFAVLPAATRRVHRVLGTVWLLSLALTLAVPSASERIPGPSIPGLSFVALVFTGTYLLLRPWVRGPTTASDRLAGLRHWTWTPSVVVRRTHRIASALFLVLLVVALAITAVSGSEPRLVLVPVVALLLYLAVTGTYMFLGPWVTRLRAG